ncbi:MAG: hypothetical protein MRJ93_00015 [Nitrososphaeraceae archaeon]|nr:hypothetical protein [Nitrososphaeraceae archaeon]
MQGVSKNNNHNSNTNSRRWTPEDKTRIVMESLLRITVAELCRKYI